MSHRLTLLFISVSVLVIVGTVTAAAMPVLSPPWHSRFTCELGRDCKQEVSREVNEEGKYLFQLFGFIRPGRPFIANDPPGATIGQKTVDRMFVARCDISQGIGSESTWECNWEGDSDPNIWWLEVGVIRRPGACSHTVYTYCHGCGGYREHPGITAHQGSSWPVKLWWEPSAYPVTSSTTGTWFVAWNDVPIRQATGPHANAVFAGSRTTHPYNDLGVSPYLGLHYATKSTATNISSPRWTPWNGPIYWSYADHPRFEMYRHGRSEAEVFTEWHLSGNPTPTAVPTEEVGCPDV